MIMNLVFVTDTSSSNREQKRVTLASSRGASTSSNSQIGEGGVKKTAEEFQKEFLGEIPINPEIGKQGDLGMPIVESKPDHEISKIYIDFAKKIKSSYL